MVPSQSNKYSAESGFTLIELVIVIVVLGVLAGIAVVRYADIQTSTAETADEANRRAIHDAIHLHFAKEILETPGYSMADAVDDYNTDPTAFFSNGQEPLKADQTRFTVSFSDGSINVE